MEEEKKTKNNTGWIVAIVVLSILVVVLGVALGGFIFYNKKNSNKVNSEKTAENETEIELHKQGNLYKNTDSKEIICSTTSNTPYAIGTKYTCNNLGDGKTYTFYVLKDSTNSSTVDLIMDRDYAKSTYIDSGGFTESNNASLGPINSIKTLPTLNVWSNLESPKDNSGYDYSQYAARLPMASEIANACNITNFDEKNGTVYELKNKSECSFLWENTQYVDSSYDYTGYYTSTPLGTYTHAWALDSNNITKEEYDAHVGAYSEIQLYDTVLLHPIAAGIELGTRPVISLSK